MLLSSNFKSLFLNGQEVKILIDVKSNKIIYEKRNKHDNIITENITDNINTPIYFISNDDIIMSLKHNGNEKSEIYPIIQYCNDYIEEDGKVYGSWVDLSSGTQLSVGAGQKVFLQVKENIGYFSLSSSNYYSFDISGDAYLSGNLISLIDNTRQINELSVPYTFYGLFENCNSLKTSPTLNVSSVADYACAKMFSGCSSLISAIELPAIQLGEGCYLSTFNGCSSLSVAPILPATDLKKSCYQSMFRDCSSLSTPPELPANSLEYSCYESMFRNTSLSTAPILSAMKLAPSCYKQMFYGCNDLSVAPELPSDDSRIRCYQGMFQLCKNLTTPPLDLPMLSLHTHAYDTMFYGCSSLSVAPIIHAKALGQQCFSSMFEKCTSLKDAPVISAALNSSYLRGNSTVIPALNRLEDNESYQKEYQELSNVYIDSVYRCYEQIYDGCSSLTSVYANFGFWSKSVSYGWLNNIFHTNPKGTIYSLNNSLASNTLVQNYTYDTNYWDFENVQLSSVLPTS